MVYKTLRHLVDDLEAHTTLLDEAIKNSKSNPVHFITVANELRTLVCKGSGQIDLVFFLADFFKIQINCIAKDGTKDTLHNYLHSIHVEVKGTQYSNLGFIKLMCNKSGSGIHVKTEIDKDVAVGKSVVIFGKDMNQHQLLAIANTVSNCIHASLYDFLNKISGEEFHKLEEKYKLTIKGD